MSRVTTLFVISLSLLTAQAGTKRSAIQVETLLQTVKAWDGSEYVAYPPGQPQVSVLKITIPAHTTMEWHRHPIPNAAYVVAGAITVEKRDGGVTRQFTRAR